MLMHVYYIYKKSPKKCRELEEIVTSLKQCLDDGDIPDKGNKPIWLVALDSLITKLQPRIDLLIVLVLTLVRGVGRGVSGNPF